MSLADIYYMEAMVLCVCVVLDIPSGALADAIGRKRTIVIGRVFLLGSVCGFATMENATDAWTANILWAIGYSMQSGADTSLLHESLKERGREREYKKIQGGAIGTRLMLLAICALVTGYLAEIDLRIPLYVCIPFVAIPLVASLFWKEPARVATQTAYAQLHMLTRGVQFACTSVTVRWMVGFAALLVTVSKIWFFVYNPYFELVGIPLSQFGILFFCLNLVAWLSSHYAHHIEQHLGEKSCIAVMILCLAIPILAMGFFPIWLCAYLVIVQNIVRGFMRPFIEDYLHRHISGNENSHHIRATVMSVQSCTANLTSIIGLALFGSLTGVISLTSSLVILGMTCLICGGMSYWCYIRRIM